MVAAHHITKYLRSLRTPLHWVQTPPTKNGSEGPVHRSQR